ncbi:gamma-glutamyltransferase [Parapedobacter defluvii]|uniref:Glutathione hydrolase proenzyme n=1 Tax=Parapedobacter defluvii TaxID=2045106 RepID=A0ABQ1N123_9SPHI|nr:gamma-glutamyltransferase [Parapedobacter defluvii]GGC48660.1 gamma-glutamyltransferase [Parapedobacter defluvii]
MKTSFLQTFFGKTRLSYLLVFLVISNISCDSFRRRNLQIYRNGVVVSAHPEASAVGLHILQGGGNAVDAAVAVQFALAVVYPNAGNIGGGGFMVYRNADGDFDALDFREAAPGAATRDMYLDAEGNPVAELSLRGQLASGVPGSVDGMVKAHEKYGKLEWSTLLKPAIDLAQSGFPVTEMQAKELNSRKESFRKYNPGGTAFLRDVEWIAGDTLVQPELAHTLTLISQRGRAGFYEGETADRIVEEMARGNGIISHADLKNYEAKWRDPISATYRGYRVVSMPPPSSGGIALISLLKSVEAYPLSQWGFQQDSTMRVIIEAERRVYADRATHLGDPDFYDVPQSMLIDSSYNAERMRNINFRHASFSSDIFAGSLSMAEHEETTHFSIVDREGNAVAITTTLNGSYGSQVVVAGAGFLLNNEMDDFSVKPGAPNMYGLIGGAANAIEPGKRMLSSMTPTILEKDGKLFMVLGTPGGSTIITSVFQTILNVVDFDMEIQEAVAAPRFHHQWLPDEVALEENAVTQPVRHSLSATGYKLVDRGSIGRVDAIRVLPDGSLSGGADPRGDDTTRGY